MRKNRIRAIQRAKYFRKKRKMEYHFFIFAAVTAGAFLSSMVGFFMVILSLMGF